MDTTPAHANSDILTQLDSTNQPKVEHVFNVSYEIADYWSRMALTHLQAGDRAATLDARQKAVDLYRVLHAKQADIFEGNLARELLSLSRDLAGCGQIEEAYAASEESRRLYMHIIGTSPSHDHDHIHEYKTTGSCKRMHDSSKVGFPLYLLKLIWNLVELPKLFIKGIITNPPKLTS